MDELTKLKIGCEHVHHQLGVLATLPQSLQVEQLEHLIARMRRMTQQVPPTDGLLILPAAARQPGLSSGAECSRSGPLTRELHGHCENGSDSHKDVEESPFSNSCLGKGKFLGKPKLIPNMRL